MPTDLLTPLPEREISLRPGRAADAASAPRTVGANKALLAKIAGSGATLVAFDVFDTVVTRKVGEPSAVFHLLGQQLQAANTLPFGPESFVQRRTDAERRARQNCAGREVTLREIYDEFVFALPLEAQVEQLVTAEISLERELMEPIPEMKPTVDQIREKFGRVIYISDMYLPESLIAERLRHFGLLQPQDALYVSSSYGGWKGDGRLFQTVLAKEGLRPAQLLHCGNAHAIDIAPARRLGLQTFHFTAANPTPAEDVLNAHAAATDSVSSFIAGASRKVRLEAPELQGDARVVWETAASITGPLVAMYARWIIERARHSGTKRLLFLARDAYLPFLAVQQLLAIERATDLEAHYVYGSRATYFPVAVERLDAAQWDQLIALRGGGAVTLTDIKKALMASDETLAAHLPTIGMQATPWDRPLTQAEHDRVRAHAVDDASFNCALLSDLAAYRQRVRTYFETMNVFEPGGTALVDTGWSTTSHAPLFEFLQGEGCRPLRLFYLGMNGLRADVPLGRLDTFIYNRVSALGPRDPRIEYPRAVETLLMAPHGRTEAFYAVDGEVRPVLAPVDNSRFLEQHFETYRRGVLRLVRECAAHLVGTSRLHDHRALAEHIIRRFWSQPTTAEARFWSSLEWEADALGKKKHRLARPYTIADAWTAFRQRRLPVCYRQFWVAGAAVQSARAPLLAIRTAIFLRRIQQRVTRALTARLRPASHGAAAAIRASRSLRSSQN